MYNKKTTEEDIRNCLSESGYELVEYVKGNICKVKHLKCGYQYETTFHNFKCGHGCKKCSGSLKIKKEEILKCFEENGYKLIEYRGIGCQTNHLVEHLLCGYQYSANYNNFKHRNARCKKCAKKLKITKEEILKVLNENGYELVEYNGEGNRTNHIVKHLLCGYTYPVNYNHFTSHNSRCRNCAGSLPITREEVSEILSNNGYKLVEYNGIGNKTKHLVEHLLCGYKYPVNYSDFKSGSSRCHKCSKRCRISKEDISKCLEENGYKLIEYNGKGNQTKHVVEHLLCGRKYPIDYNSFKNSGHRCSKCGGKLKITEEDVSNILNDNGYKLIKYNGMGIKTKHLVEHLLCGNQYSVNYDNFKHAMSRCNKCSKSRSENECRRIFEMLFPDYKFSNTKPKFLGGLELDGYCENLKLAFEYNGVQHYEVSDGLIPYDDEEGLQKRKERDKKKLEICNRLGIRLCVIPYTYDFRDPEKLENFIREWCETEFRKPILVFVE